MECMNCAQAEKYEELFSLARDGELEDTDSFYSHLADCEDCRRAFSQYQEILGMLRELDDVPGGFVFKKPKNNILRNKIPRIFYTTVSVAACILIVFGTVIHVYNNYSNDAPNDMTVTDQTVAYQTAEQYVTEAVMPSVTPGTVTPAVTADPAVSAVPGATVGQIENSLESSRDSGVYVAAPAEVPAAAPELAPETVTPLPSAEQTNKVNQNSQDNYNDFDIAESAPAVTKAEQTGQIWQTTPDGGQTANNQTAGQQAAKQDESTVTPTIPPETNAKVSAVENQTAAPVHSAPPSAPESSVRVMMAESDASEKLQEDPAEDSVYGINGEGGAAEAVYPASGGSGGGAVSGSNNSLMPSGSSAAADESESESHSITVAYINVSGLNKDKLDLAKSLVKKDLDSTLKALDDNGILYKVRYEKQLSSEDGLKIVIE